MVSCPKASRLSRVLGEAAGFKFIDSSSSAMLLDSEHCTKSIVPELVSVDNDESNQLSPYFFTIGPTVTVDTLCSGKALRFDDEKASQKRCGDERGCNSASVVVTVRIDERVVLFVEAWRLTIMSTNVFSFMSIESNDE